MLNTCELICGRFSTDDNCILISSKVARESKWLVDLLVAEKINVRICDHNLLFESKRKLLRLLNIVRNTLRGRLNEYLSIEKEAERIIVFSPDMLASCIRYCNPDAEVFIGEDGVGTYTGVIYDRIFFLGNNRNDRRSAVKWIAERINSSVLRGKLSLRPSKILLHAPELSVVDQPGQVERVVPSKLWLNIRRDASEKDHGSIKGTYAAKEVIFLGQPLPDCASGLSESIIKLIEKLGFTCSYRKHPREQCDIDGDSAGIWELRCAYEMSSETVLVSYCSTAAITPRMLYGIEPYLIFLYPILNEAATRSSSDSIRIIERLKSVYDDSKKIQVAHSFEELECILTEIHNNRSDQCSL